jgi:succinate dehydrogenase / fumarate reductase flavoprotein subunit
VDENPYETPMMIYPAIHYTMGGIWVDYELQSTIPGLFVGGEANFSDHGANRLGASALMQGLSDGYFVLPYTMQNYLADQINVPHFTTDLPEFDKAEKELQDQIDKILNINGEKTVDTLHKKLGLIMWNYVGMARNAKGLEKAIKELKELKKEFWTNVKVTGSRDGMNTELEKAIRLADFIELGELMAYDALNREESCGGHFREEYQTEDGEAVRNDKNFAFVSAWEYTGEDKEPKLNKEPLVFENVKLTQRNYKTA